MPWKPVARCSTPGCNREAVHRGRCRPCGRQYEAERGSARSRGYDRRHERWRRNVLARHPLCQSWPREEECLAPATVADHVVPIRTETRDRALELVGKMLGADALADLEMAISWKSWLRFAAANGQGLCARCHGRKTARGL